MVTRHTGARPSVMQWVLAVRDTVVIRVTTCLENLEMSGNLTAVREMSGILLKVTEMSGKSCLKLFIVNCIFDNYLCPYRYLVGVSCVLNIKYMVSNHALLHSYSHH